MQAQPDVARVLGRLAVTAVLASSLYLVVYRPLQLRWGATAEEAACRMPGDQIQPRPIFNATRALTIDAPPEKAWPWLVQIGYKRAGWYSNLDWLDNDGIPSATRIIPALQRLNPGDPLPVWRDITQRVVELEPDRYLLTSSLSGTDSWLWALVPVDARHTRLIWRMRSAPYAWTSPLFLVRQLATDLGDFVVVRNILLGIKERTEGRPIGSLAASTTDVVFWLMAFAAFLVALAALSLRRDWRRPLTAVGTTCVATLVLVFSLPARLVSAVVVIGVNAALWWLLAPRVQAGEGTDRPAKPGAPGAQPPQAAG